MFLNELSNTWSEEGLLFVQESMHEDMIDF